MSNELVELGGHIQAETTDAYLFVPDAAPGKPSNFKLWLPKSKCTWQPDYSHMEIPRWLAEKEHLV